MNNNTTNTQRYQPSSSIQMAQTLPHIGASKPKQPKTKAASKTKPANGSKSGSTRISLTKLVAPPETRRKFPRCRKSRNGNPKCHFPFIPTNAGQK